MFCDGNNELYGVVRRCILNNLSNFHVLVNIIVDLMHDLLLGVLKYDIIEILQYYAINKLLDFEAFNRRLKRWNFGKKENVKIRRLRAEDCIKGNISMTAKEMWFFIENLPFLLNGLVAPSTEYFEFVLIIHDLLDLCLQPEFGPIEIHQLKTCINLHHNFYKIFMGKGLTPKFHFLLHYADVIEKCGPLKDLMCMRQEAKHQELKSYTNVSHNRRNVPVSIANKQALRFSDTILNFNPDCLDNKITLVKESDLIPEVIKGAAELFLTQNQIVFEHIHCAKEINYKGTVFTSKEYLIIDDSTAALMEGFIVAGTTVLVLYHQVFICFVENMRAYKLSTEYDSFLVYNFIENFKFIPVPGNKRWDNVYIKQLKRYIE